MAFDLLNLSKQASTNPGFALDTQTAGSLVLSGVNDWLKGAMNNVNRGYVNRGFGNRISAPTLYNTMAKPYVEQGANQVSQGLMNINNFNESKRRFDLLRKDRLFAASEAGNEARKNKAEADKWYNWL